MNSIGQAMYRALVAGSFLAIASCGGGSGEGTAPAFAPSSQSKATPSETPTVAPRSCPPWPAFPDESCTGVTPGHPLVQVDGDLETTADGQTIDGRFITGDLAVNHDNVTVTNARIKGRVYNRNRTGLLLQDVDIGQDGCPAQSSGSGQRLIVGDSGYTLVRAHLHHNDDDMLITGGGAPVVIRDSLIHSTCWYPGDHLDALQFYDPHGIGNVTIAHSNIDVRPVNTADGGFGNSAVFWADEPGAGSRLTITDSRLAGGGYTLAPYDSGRKSGVVVTVRNTTFVRNAYQYAACSLGGASPSGDISPTIPYFESADGKVKEGLVWENNRYDNGTPLASCQ